MATQKPGFFSNVYRMFTPVTTVAGLPGAAPAPVAAAPVASPPPADPLAEMATLWKNDPNKPQPVDPLQGPILQPDNNKIAEAAGKVNFLEQVPAELLQRVNSGNDPAALAELINTVAQRTLATATQIGAATTEQGIKRNNQRIEQALPGRIKQVQLDGVTVENPALAHEASQPMLRMVRAQIHASNPHLTPEAINKQAEAILLRHAQAVIGVTEDAGFRPGGLPQNNAGPNGKETDWEAWAGS